MGSILKLTKNSGARWGKSTEIVAQSFVTNSVMKVVKQPLGRKTIFRDISYSSLVARGGVRYRVGNTTFAHVGNTFGCREGLTRDLQQQNHSLGKNSVLLVRNKTPLAQTTYKDMFSDSWVDFLKDFLGHIGMNDNLIDRLGIYSKNPARLAFPVDNNQTKTFSTLAAALILLTRNPTVFCRDRGKKGLRNYREVIQELVRDKLVVAKNMKSGVRTTQIYTRNTANFILWHLVYYLDLMPAISKAWVGNTPNGPDTYVTYGTPRIAAAIKKLDKIQMEDLLDIVGGENSVVLRGFPSSVNLAIQDRAEALK